MKPTTANVASWSGRIAVRAQAPAAPSGQSSFNAQFDLQGSATSGALRLFSPFGTTLAQVNWQPRAARLLNRGEAQDFADLDALMIHLLGINLPSEALFAWLRGEAATATGWQVDLGEHANGRISAVRLAAPKAQLTVLFEAHNH